MIKGNKNRKAGCIPEVIGVPDAIAHQKPEAFCDK